MDRSSRPRPPIVIRVGAALLALGYCGAAGAQSNLEGTRPILKSILEASDLNEGERRILEARFDTLAQDVAGRFGAIRSPERRARRLHRWLHERVFEHYRADADGIDDAIVRGDFNCVSSVLVEGLLDRAVGLTPTIIAEPHHLLLRLTLPTRTVEIETTSKIGFDTLGRASAGTRLLLADRDYEAGPDAARGDPELRQGSADRRPEVPFAQGAAFVWHNAAERALARGEGRAAAEHLLAGETLYPGVAGCGESLQTELGRAFRLEYDAARFDDAYVTAAIGVRLGPSVVSARDRLIAAAAQRVERLVDAGDVGQAEDVLVELRGMLGDESNRFERHVLPMIVAASVRVGDWERAACLSDRYGDVELDAVEARRLQTWVRGRRSEAEAVR